MKVSNITILNVQICVCYIENNSIIKNIDKLLRLLIVFGHQNGKYYVGSRYSNATRITNHIIIY